MYSAHKCLLKKSWTLLVWLVFVWLVKKPVRYIPNNNELLFEGTYALQYSCQVETYFSIDSLEFFYAVYLETKTCINDVNAKGIELELHDFELYQRFCIKNLNNRIKKVVPKKDDKWKIYPKIQLKLYFNLSSYILLA